MQGTEATEKIFEYLEKDFWDDPTTYSSVESLIKTVCGNSEKFCPQLVDFINRYLVSSRLPTGKKHYLETLNKLKCKMSKSSQKQKITAIGCQKKGQKDLQEVQKARRAKEVNGNRVIKNNGIELKNSESLTEDQKQERRRFIDYLESHFFNDSPYYENAENLMILKSFSSFEFRTLNPQIREFMDHVIKGKLQIPSPKEYSDKIKDLLQKINHEVFLPKNLVDSQNLTQSDQYKGTLDNGILQQFFIPLRDLINNLTSTSQPESNGPLNTNQIEIENDIEECTADIQCRVEYRQIDFNELDPFFIDFLDTFTGKEISLPRKGMDEYSPVERIHVNDEFSLWAYDPFQGCIDLSFRSPNGGPLPKKIKLEKNYFKNNPHSIVRVKGEYEPAQEIERNDISMSLEEFLKKVVEVSGKEKKLVANWIDKFNLNDVHRFEEIFAWGETDWNQANLPVNAKRLIRTHLNHFRVKVDKSQETHELTEAEKYSIVHNIKRFCIWKAHPKELKKIPYIDKRALEAGFEEIKKDYAGEELLSELKIFYKRFTTPKSYSASIAFSRGLLFFGPPGTGKSELTKAIASKIGLTPISYALCAAEVNRPHVGETERVLEDLCARALKIPYLWCCIAVDEIDVLTPKRDEKSSEHKISALGTLLGLIGGIKDVSNLMFLASTNFLTKIDEAWRRRMSGQFFVGRPSPKARKIIFETSDQTFLSDSMIDQLVNITTNFSGAALKQYISYIVSETKDFNETNQLIGESLSYQALAELAAVTSKQFNVRLGSYSLPELFFNQKPKESLLGSSFLNLLEGNNILLLNFEKKIVEVLYKCYRTTKPTISTQNPQKIAELGHLKILNDLGQDPRSFIANLQLPQTKSKSKIAFSVDFVDLLEVPRFQKADIHDYLTQKVQNLKKRADSKSSTKCILVWLDLLGQTIANNVDPLIIKSWFQANFKSLEPKNNHYHFFATNESSLSNILEMIYWKDLAPLNKKQINYSGRIMIDLSEEEPEMRFETDGKDSEGLHSEPLLLNNCSGHNTLQVIPKIVEFASERKIDFILLMDQDFLLSNHAFDDSKTKENVAEKMEEFKCYPRSLLLIDVDSMVGIAKSITESSMGPSTSYSLTDTKLYNMILHYARSIPQILPKSEYWIALVSKHKELSKMIKKDLEWPMTRKEFEEEEKQKEKQKETRCLRCGEIYIEAKNELNHCTYHDGFFFEASAPSDKWEIIEDISQVRNLEFAKNAELRKSAPNQINQNKEVLFVCIACMQPYNSQGCQKYKHINDKNLLIQPYDVRQEYEEKFTNFQLGLDSL